MGSIHFLLETGSDGPSGSDWSEVGVNQSIGVTVLLPSLTHRHGIVLIIPVS